MNKRGEFPSGLLHILQDYTSGFKGIQTEDLRKKPERYIRRFKLDLPHTPYESQFKAVQACLKEGRGVISAVTGYGKSVMMAMLLAEMGLDTLIIVPTLGLKSQLTESFLAYFGQLAHITIENIDSKNLQKPGKYDMIIIDEAHHVAAKTYRDLNKRYWGNIYHRFFFTATPFRTRDEEQLLFESIAGQVIYRIGYKEAVDLGAIVPIEVFYIELPKSPLKGVNIGHWPSVYNALVVHNEARNKLIAELLQGLDKGSISTLCLVTEIAHGENLKKLTGGYFASGVNDDTKHYIDLFNREVLTTLIGTTGVLGEGIDTRPAEWVIIAGLGKSRPRFMQQCGRGLRKYAGKESCKVIIFKDNSHKWTKAHYAAQVKILKEEYGIVPIKLDI